MRWDFFHRAENANFDRNKPCSVFTFDLPDSTTLEEALSHAYKNGLPKGSARAGCVEVQNDLGIYSQIKNARIDLSTPRRAANVVFKTWEELEKCGAIK